MDDSDPDDDQANQRTARRTDPTEADHIQLGLHWPTGYRPSSAPPATRGECADLPRPCPRTGCPHHLHRDDEPCGRPSDGSNMRRMPIRVNRERGASCALDEAEKGEHTTPQIAEYMGLTTRRVLQIEDRAMVKQRLATMLLEYLEPFRARLPEGVEMALDAPRHGNTHGVQVTITFGELEVAALAKRLGITRRRREPG